MTEELNIRNARGHLPFKKMRIEYNFDCLIGRGSCGEVLQGYHKKTKRNYVAKQVMKKKVYENDVHRVYREIETLKGLNHPNIVKCYESYESEDVLAIIMDYIPGKNLHQFIFHSKRCLTEAEARSLMRSMVSALSYCNQKGVLHRDIKPENIVLNDAQNPDFSRAILVDFGLSIGVVDPCAMFAYTRCGTQAYWAPEVGRGLDYNYKCDVWSVGMVLFFLLCGETPLRQKMKELKVESCISYADQPEDIKDFAVSGEFEFLPENTWARVSEEARDFIKQACCLDVSKRFTYEEMQDHFWLQEPFDLEHLYSRAARQEYASEVAFFGIATSTHTQTGLKSYKEEERGEESLRRLTSYRSSGDSSRLEAKFRRDTGGDDKNPNTKGEDEDALDL